MALGMTSTAKVRPFVAPVRRGRTSDSGGDQVERPFISSAMLAVMMVIASEMMLFSGLIGTFLVYRMQSAFWPPPALPRLPIAVTWVNTFVLLSSAATITLALRSVHQSRQRLTRPALKKRPLVGESVGASGGTCVRVRQPRRSALPRLPEPTRPRPSGPDDATFWSPGWARP